MTTVKAYIGLGSNLGDRSSYIDRAVGLLKNTHGVELMRLSDIIETEPLGHIDQPKYFNAVAEITTSLPPEELFTQMQKIESTLDRNTGSKWQARTIDLDLLLYKDQIIKTDQLQVPHSQLHLRTFVLKGLSQIAPDLIHPSLNISMAELLNRLNGGDFFIDPEKPKLVSIAGLIGVGKTTLGQKLAEQFGTELLREPYDTNPYMPEVYAGKADQALNSQLYFLNHRVEQLDPESLKPGKAIFTDYIFEKELIYSEKLLDKAQLHEYEKQYPTAYKNVAKPILVIYLKDSPGNCLERIHERNRPYEQKIKREFLTELNKAYDRMLSLYKHCPVITVLKSQFDCHRDPDIQYLSEQIKVYIGS